ncbi:uncharacterized protein LOC123988177 isoform X4 [Osmia bicornis bicornis]|uniref:uncharacterized protein LOC123988177 isoform X4 n=1 Tax=Osmia bicornis bicornis TaxID=1437191 RepID=UPI001EAF8A93|nr:uncharacterized protein LOC123988177 isoform X4 [Osmia bicornis bicornis]
MMDFLSSTMLLSFTDHCEQRWFPVTALSSIFIRSIHLCPDCGITIDNNAIFGRKQAKLLPSTEVK